MTPFDRARAIIDEYERALRSELPEGVLLYDAHTHLGHDIDGSRGHYEELTAVLDHHGFARAFMFCLDEHDREPGFSIPNDRTLAHAERSGGRLVPFVRLDLIERPLEEARRCLELGARGIKLHPRAQAFALDDERLGPIFELAVGRGVPILIHGGRGLPPIALNLANLVDRYEGVRLIVAHAGIADMADLTARLGGAPGVFFDTSVWSAVDLLDLFRQVAPEQIVYASDYPYGRQPNSLLLSIRTAHLAGFDDRQLRAMLGENARRIADKAAAGAEHAARRLVARPAVDVRAHPPVHFDGGAPPLAPSARRRDRGARPRGQRLTGAERSRRGGLADPGAARGGERALARGHGDGLRRRARLGDADGDPAREPRRHDHGHDEGVAASVNSR